MLKKINWPVAVGLTVIHVGALAAFWPGFFSWSGLVVAMLLSCATGGVGITVCYHRSLTHRGLKLVKPLEYATALLGTLAFQGGPISWVATHRAHHAAADREGDPHGMDRGFLWAHMLWMFARNSAVPNAEERRRLAPDLVSDGFYRFLDRFSIELQILLAVALFAAGGWSWFIWGIFVRLVVNYHGTWLVNSAAHAFGYRSYKTNDRSTNCWWVALITWGEGWHNNHHAFPFSARHGLRRIEIDWSWFLIKFLAFVRLASDIKVPTAEMRERLRLASVRATSSMGAGRSPNMRGTES